MIKFNWHSKFSHRNLAAIFAFGLSLSALPALALPTVTVHERAQKNDFPLFVKRRAANILHDEKDAKVVGIVADLLKQDIQSVTDGAAATAGALTAIDPSQAVIIGTLDGSALVKGALAGAITKGITQRDFSVSADISD